MNLQTLQTAPFIGDLVGMAAGLAGGATPPGAGDAAAPNSTSQEIGTKAKGHKVNIDQSAGDSGGGGGKRGRRDDDAAPAAEGQILSPTVILVVLVFIVVLVSIVALLGRG